MCGARQMIEAAIMGVGVEIVLGVPGFAQSNSSYRTMVAVERTSSAALREYAADRTVMLEVAHEPAAIPPNLVVPVMYRPLLLEMLERSSTFRRQCHRLANTPELTVNLLTTASARDIRLRARTRIVRKPVGLIATIEFLQLADAPELIAHEIEHIIEQLDGIDLAARASVAASGVHLRDGPDALYETERAKRVGLTVAADMRRRN